MKTLNAHYDGKFVILDEPTALKPHTKVKVLAPETSSDSVMIDDYAKISEPVFQKIWDNPLDADYDRL